MQIDELYLTKVFIKYIHMPVVEVQNQVRRNIPQFRLSGLVVNFCTVAPVFDSLKRSGIGYKLNRFDF